MVLQIHQQVAGRLGHPTPRRLRGDPHQMNATPLHLDDEQDVQPSQAKRFDREEIARQRAGGLRPQELLCRARTRTRV
jgi:hypothetical protein